MTAPTLETERLTLRPIHPDDVEAWIAFYLSERTQYMGGASLDRFDAWRRFAMQVGHWTIRGFGFFCLRRRGEDRIIGAVGCWRPETWPENEIGWCLWADAEGHGYATEGARAVRAHAYQALGWTTAVSYIDPANQRSIAVAERLGAQRDPAAEAVGDDPCLVYRHPSPAELGLGAAA